MEEFRLTEEEIKLVEKWSGQKLSIKSSSTHKRASLKKEKDNEKLTKGEKLDLILKDKIFEKEDLTPEELDDLLIPEEEWDDYE